MQRLQFNALQMYQELLAQQPTTPAKVTFAWQLAAGPALGRSATAEWIDGVLRVHARDDAWRREIRRARPIITERLSTLLGPDVVRRLEID